MGGPCYVEGHGTPDVTDNFHLQRFVLNGVEFFCVEQAFQAMKFKDPSHQETVSKLRPEEGPKRAAFGRQCFRAGNARLPSFRTEWDGIKAEVMYRASRAKFMQNSDSASKLADTGEAAITRPDDPDGFWALWNCYIMKRIRIELKPPAKRSETETKLLEMIESKFDLQASIFQGEDTINSSEFNVCCPRLPYAHEGGTSGGVAPTSEKTQLKEGKPSVAKQKAETSCCNCSIL
mmetsp:Transcript_124599/g.248630  ORF Transcript_124599/g.248630 Transcript_124599/m.248630 type:complete len:234 (+) Transcript_124599:66-767(+)